MPCPLTTNYVPKDCKEPSGVKSFRLIEFANVTAITIVANVVTVITLAVGKKFFKYSQEPEVADFKCNGTADGKMKTYGFDLEANFQMYGLEPLQNAEIELLIKNKLICIAELTNGNFYLIGHEYGLDVATDTFESGVAFNDFSGDKIQLKGRSTIKPIKVDSTIIAALTTV